MLKTRLERVRDWLVSTSGLFGLWHERINQARSRHFLLQGIVANPVILKSSKCMLHAYLNDPIDFTANAGRLHYACVRAVV
jgi:hypothetical protein